MKELTFQDTVGFSVQDTLALYWLHATISDPQYPKELHREFMDTFPGRKVGYVYVARVAARLEQEQCLKSATVSGKKYYAITELGQKRLEQYQTTYFQRFDEVAAVIDRFYYELTKNGPPPSKEFELLHEDFRPFLAKLLSVKDVVRYMALRLSLNRHSFFMAEVLIKKRNSCQGLPLVTSNVLLLLRNRMQGVTLIGRILH